MTNDIGDKRFESPADSRWDREVHKTKGIVVDAQWRDLAEYCDTHSLKEMALIGPDIASHLAESHSAKIYPIDCDGKVIRVLQSSISEMPAIIRQRVPYIGKGEFFRWVKNSPLISEGVNYLDYDSMSVGMRDVIDVMYDGLAAALKMKTQPFFIIRITFIDKVRGHSTDYNYLQEMLTSLGFQSITPVTASKNKYIPVSQHGWIEPSETGYLYKNETRRCSMWTGQYIRNNK